MVATLANDNIITPPRKKFKSYTTQSDDANLSGTSDNMSTAKSARHELDIYLQMNITNYLSSSEGTDNPLLFWKEQQNCLSYMSKLAKRMLSIPGSSAAVERAFSSAGVVISQQRTNLNSSTINDITLIRSAARYLNTST